MKETGRLFTTFLKIGAFTFGGGYAMLALLETECVEKKGWLTREEFLDMVAVSESTPGPVAVNSATYIGYQVAGVRGAALATLAVCLPSFVLLYLISLFFDGFLGLHAVARAFCGIRVCVIYLIFSAGLRLWKSMQKNVQNVVIWAAVLAVMLGGTVCAASLSSVCLILACGAVGVLLSLCRKAGKGRKKS